jgi:hypothetical protein
VTGHDVGLALIGAGLALLGFVQGWLMGRTERTRRRHTADMYCTPCGGPCRDES